MQKFSGFTLIELIVVIVLLGIMATGAGLLITRPIEAYEDQLRRQQLVDSAEMTLRRIATDIRRALPNSIRLRDSGPNSWALEMVNTVDGARYRDEAGGGYNTNDQLLDFSANDNQFNVLGQLSNLGNGFYAGLRTVIYNTTPATIYSDASANAGAGANPGIVSASGITLSDDGVEQRVLLSTARNFRFQSPGQRLFIVDGPVSYICDDATGTLTRYSNYAFQANHANADSDAGLSALAGVQVGRVASQVSRCAIDYDPGTAQRGGLITLDITLTDRENENVTMLHQVHVDNVP